MKKCIKSEQLGLSVSTANNRLRRMIMFDLICKTGQNQCFRCGLPMTIDDWSIEHKEDWLHSSNELFWSLDNISFSHKSCNYSASRCNARKDVPEGYIYCTRCETLLSCERFTPSIRHLKSGHCNKCKHKDLNQRKRNKRN